MQNDSLHLLYLHQHAPRINQSNAYFLTSPWPNAGQVPLSNSGFRRECLCLKGKNSTWWAFWWQENQITNGDNMYGYSSFLLFWAELQTGDGGKMLEEGAEALRSTAPAGRYRDSPTLMTHRAAAWQLTDDGNLKLGAFAACDPSMFTTSTSFFWVQIPLSKPTLGGTVLTWLLWWRRWCLALLACGRMLQPFVLAASCSFRSLLLVKCLN